MKSVWDKGDKKLLVVGHRGAPALFPENTMVGFKKTLELGVDGFETDVRMSKDGVLMLMHDPTLVRTTTAEGGGIEDYTYEELMQFDAGVKYSEEFKGEKIPTLEEFLDFCKEHNLLMNIEMKSPNVEVLEKTIKMISEKGLDDNFVIASWHGDITVYAQEKLGVRVQCYPKSCYPNFKEAYLENVFSVGIPMYGLTPEVCEEFRQRNVSLWSWCPDTDEAIEKSIAAGMVGVVANDPRPALAANEK